MADTALTPRRHHADTTPMPTSLAKRPFHGGTILAMDNKVVIAGGGIGGLACALALGRSGVPVTVLEQAEQFDEVGAGVQLGPNAVRVLALP